MNALRKTLALALGVAGLFSGSAGALTTYDLTDGANSAVSPSTSTETIFGSADGTNSTSPSFGTLWTAPIDKGAVGTGNIDPFLRTGGGPVNPEYAYNSDWSKANPRPTYTDFNSDATWTSSLLLSAVPVVTTATGTYYEFLLDINQTKESPYLSLDFLAIFLSNTIAEDDTFPAITSGFYSGSGAASGFDLIWTLDYGTTDQSVLLNYALSAGSGNSFDVQFLVPTSLFSPTQTYVTFVTGFGYYTGTQKCGKWNVTEKKAKTGYWEYEDGTSCVFTNNDGFEEWSVAVGEGGVPPSFVPEPNSLALMGIAALGIPAFARRRKIARLTA